MSRCRECGQQWCICDECQECIEKDDIISGLQADINFLKKQIKDECCCLSVYYIQGTYCDIIDELESIQEERQRRK